MELEKNNKLSGLLKAFKQQLNSPLLYLKFASVTVFFSLVISFLVKRDDIYPAAFMALLNTFSCIFLLTSQILITNFLVRENNNKLNDKETEGK